MEHSGKTKKLNQVKPNGGLNKSSAPQRLRAYIANQTQPTRWKKLHSVTAQIKRLVMEKVYPIFRSATSSTVKEVPLKEHIHNYIGIDIAAETFATTIYHSPDKPKVTQESLSNSLEGFAMLSSWLKTQNITPENSVVCMEATGVYGEAIVHYLAAEGFRVAVEPPLKVKRSFDQDGHKTDAVDSAQIAEYAFRFFDELRFWQPRPETLEKLKHFLTAREQLVKQSVATQNALKAYQHHVIKDQSLIQIQQQHLSQIKEHISTVEKHIQQLVSQDPSLRQLSFFLVSLCGFGILLTAYLLVMTNAFQDISNFKQFAAFLGICPLKHQSGKSLRTKDHSRFFGPAYTRKLLHLAARSVATHHPEFRKYYLRKIEQGKNKSLILNNIGNKLLKIAFALVRDRQPYIKGYRSVHPLILQNA